MEAGESEVGRRGARRESLRRRDPRLTDEHSPHTVLLLLWYNESDAGRPMPTNSEGSQANMR